jgi:flagellin
MSEVDRIANVTTFNGVQVLNGSIANGMQLQVGIFSSANDSITFSIGSSGSANIGTLTGGTTTTLSSMTVSTQTNAQTTLQSIDNALATISSNRATIGAVESRLNTTIANLANAQEQMSAANSRIRDVDVAATTADLTRNQILSQAGTSILAQSNQLPGAALSLLGGH